MDRQILVSTEPSIGLWLAATLVAVLGLRAFLEYLRRMQHQGAIGGWLDLAFAAFALQACVWSTVLVGIASQGLSYPVGYHPLRLFGTLAIGVAVCSALLFWIAWRPGWLSLILGGSLLAPLALAQQIAVVWSIGAEPGVIWRPQFLVFALIVLLVGLLASMGFVLTVARGSKQDRGWRRLLAALIAAVALVCAQELVLLSAGLPGQTVSGYARYMPEIAVTLLAGGAMPIVFIVMIVDLHMQRRIRRATRRRRHGVRDGRGDRVGIGN